MSIRIKRRWILAISCLVISGCTEKTIVTEVPATGSTEASAPESNVADNGSSTTTGDGSNMVSGDTDVSDFISDTTGDGSNMVSGDANTDVESESDTTTDSDEDTDLLEDPLSLEQSDDNLTDTPDTTVSENEATDEATDETTSEAVDCGRSLPCLWTSADGQFSVTVTRADNRSKFGVLQLEYSISTVHDTLLSVGEGGVAVDESAVYFQPKTLLLEGKDGSDEQELLAGSAIEGQITFDIPTESSLLSEWSIIMLDGGFSRLPSFSNIPVDTITHDIADCQLELPCIWVTPQGDVTVTLTSAGGFASSGNLSTAFTVQSATTIDVALEPGALAISTRGTQYEGRTHILGTKTGHKTLVAEAYAGYDLSGSIQYYKKTEIATALNELSLILHQDDPVPRWNPKFTNIPIQ